MSYPLEREIDFDFDFDFDSSVRGGRGEAVCACETCLLNAGADLGKLSAARGGFVSNISCYACGFYLTTFTWFGMSRAVYLLKYVWVLTIQ